MKICIISHESCPYEGGYSICSCLREQKLKAELCYLQLSLIFLTVQIHLLIWTLTDRQSEHPHTQHRHAYNTCTPLHKMTPKYREQTQQLPDYSLPFFSLLQLSLYCTCLKFQAVTLSVPRRLIFNAVSISGLLTHTHTYMYTYTDTHTNRCTLISMYVHTHKHTHQHKKACTTTHIQIRRTQTHIDIIIRPV